MRQDRLVFWIESKAIQSFIIFLIVLNAITLGMETDAQLIASHGTWLRWIDQAILTVFVIEILLKLYAYRINFFRSPWNLFDFFIISIALMPNNGSLSILRILRILRVLRLISVIPPLRLIIEALLKSIPGIASIACLMLLLFYMFAVMATNLYAQDFPQWFGSIGASMYTLFQIMTLESWSMGIVRPVMAKQPFAWVFFIPFILIATFTMLNLFIGVIVDTIQTLHEKNHPPPNDLQALLTEVKALRKEVKQLQSRKPIDTPPN